MSGIWLEDTDMMLLSAVTARIAAVIYVRVRHLVCRNRCRIDRINELLGLCCHSGSKQCTLTILRCSTSEIIVFSLEGRNLLVAQVVQNSSGSCVLAVDNVSGVVVHGVLECTGVLRHVVIYALDCFPGLAAALSKLRLECVSVLHVGYSVGVNSLLDAEASLHDVCIDAVESGKHTVIHGIEAITQAAGQAVQFADNCLVVKATLDCGIGVCASGCSTSAVSPAIATPSAESENE
nr:MAG TPA: hypothetical protein [Caudoviricetes sp.]